MTLYPANGASILPREDYDAVLSCARGAQAVIEFGPGLTTLALFEAGVPYVESFEHELKWARRAQMRREPMKPAHVCWRVRRYKATRTKLPRPYLARRYDLGVVDGPQGGDKWQGPPGYEMASRYIQLKYALEHCERVLLHDAQRPGERESLRLAGCRWEMITGKFALCWM